MTGSASGGGRGGNGVRDRDSAPPTPPCFAFRATQGAPPRHSLRSREGG
jgi:hypothetical protein